MLADGIGTRAVARLTGIHRDTIQRLMLAVGAGCAALHNDRVRGVRPTRLELDEIYSFVGKRQQHVTDTDPQWLGSNFTYLALAEGSRLLVSYWIGKRTADTTLAFVEDIRSRVANCPEFSTDGFGAYVYAIRRVFGPGVAHGQVIKRDQMEAKRLNRERAGKPVERYWATGEPQKICTNSVERQNLSLRMGSSRFRRASSTHSKSIRHHAAGISLYVFHYNFCRVHEALKTTPAVASGLADWPWTLTQMVEAALSIAKSEKIEIKEGEVSHWWRAYDEAMNDPKLQLLPDPVFKGWFNLMCLASSKGGKLPSIDDIAFSLRMTPAKVKALVGTLKDRELLDEADGILEPHNWSGRQFKSDTSTGRVKLFRERTRNVSCNVSEDVSATPPETETEQIPEAKASGKRRATRLDPEWSPDGDDVGYALSKGLSSDRTRTEAEKFRNYWTAKGGKDAAKLNWSATWQNWILNVIEREGSRNAGSNKTGTDAGRRNNFFAGLAEVAEGLDRDGSVAGAADSPLPRERAFERRG